MTKKVITALGRGNYQETEYYFVESKFSGRKIVESLKESSKTPFIAVAISEFFPDYEEFYFLLTKEIENSDTFSEVKTRLEAKGRKVFVRRIKVGRREEDIWSAFDAFDSILKEGDEVIFDITLAFRSIPVYTMALLRFFNLTRNVKMESVLYGAFEARDTEQNLTPVFDLTPVVNVFRWTDGVESLLKYDDATELRELLNNFITHSKIDSSLIQPLKKLQSSLLQYSNSILLSNSEEVSISSINIRKTLGEIHKKSQGNIDTVLPKPVIELFRRLNDDIEKFAFSDDRFTKDTLKRDIHIAKHYADRRLFQQAFTLLRELMVDFVIYAWKGEISKDVWLDKAVRQRAERFLGLLDVEKGNALSFITSDEGVKKQLKALSSLWKSITELRNHVNHAGRNKDKDKLKNVDEKVKKYIKDYKDLIENQQLVDTIRTLLSQDDSEKPVLLITPLGLSRGLIYTAIKKTNPDEVYVITTETIKDSDIKEAVMHSHREIPFKVFRLKDPFTDFTAWKMILTDEQFVKTVRNKRLIFNITGGTTAIQHNIQQLINYFKHEIRFVPGRVVVCIDKRPVEEQRKNPYVEGEMEEIDAW